MKKNNKLIHMVESLNDKLSCHDIDDESIEIRHSEYGFICILDNSEDLRLAEEIIRDELFDKSEQLA